MKYKSGGITSKILLGALATLVIAMFVYNTTHQPEVHRDVWNMAMTKGDSSSENYFVEYTDMFCPYCAKFNRVLDDNFHRDYIDSGKVFFELRLTDIISDHSENSERGGEAGYCAAKQAKFWDFYDAMLAKLYDDYHSRGIGVSKTSPKIPKLDDSYYLDVATSSGLDSDQMQSCFESGEALSELRVNTSRASQTLQSGVPFFIVNTFTSSGFDGSYETVEMMLKAGGV